MPEPRRPQARRERSHVAMLVAARTLLRAEGPAAVTHQRVAVEAGVGRATVYRHWSRPEHLLLDVVAGADLAAGPLPCRPIRTWLAGELRRLADEPALPELAGALAGRTPSPGRGAGPRATEAVDRLTARLSAALAEAVAAGELRTGTAPDDAAALLVGPLLYRTAVQCAAVTDTFIERLLDAVGRWRRPA